MKRYLGSVGCALSLLSLCAACVPTQPTQPRWVDDAARLVGDSVKKPYADLLANFSFVACKRETLWALRALRRACAESPSANSVTMSLPGAAGKTLGFKLCAAEAARSIDKEVRDRFKLKLSKQLYELSHEVIYFTDSLPTLDREREKQILDLIAVPALSTTKWWIITGADKNDAEATHRLEWAVSFLLKNGVAPDKLEILLKYQMAIPLNEMSPLDVPIEPEPNDPTRIVWVVRLPC